MQEDLELWECSRLNDAYDRYLIPEVIIKATASTTIAQIYTMAFVLQGDYQGMDSYQQYNGDAND